MLTLDISLVGDDGPAAIGLVHEVLYFGLEVDLCTSFSGSFGHRVR